MLPTTTLRPVLSALGQIARGKTRLPILNHVRATHDESGTTFAVTDLENYLTWTAPAPDPGTLAFFAEAARRRRHAPVDALIPWGDFTHIASLVKEPRIEINGVTGKISGTAADGTTHERTFPVLAAQEFPLEPEPKTPAAFPIPRLGDRLKRLQPFLSDDQTRYVLNGVFFDANGNLVATDGRIMAVMDESAEEQATRAALEALNQAAPGDFILPAKSVSLLCHLLKKEPSAAVSVSGFSPNGKSMTLEGGRLTFQHGPWRLTAKLIEDNYPRYPQAVPGHLQTQPWIDESWPARHFTAAACERIRALLSTAKGDEDKVKLWLNQLGWSIVVETQGGSARIDDEECPSAHALAALQGHDTTATTPACFRPRLLLAHFLQPQPHGLTMHIKSPRDPAVLRAPGWLSVLMPLKINS